MKYTFSGHESFPCNSLWLKKGKDVSVLLQKYVLPKSDRSFEDFSALPIDLDLVHASDQKEKEKNANIMLVRMGAKSVDMRGNIVETANDIDKREKEIAQLLRKARKLGRTIVYRQQNFKLRIIIKM